MNLKGFILTDEAYEELESSGFDAEKELAYIQKVGKEWCVFGDSGRKMGCYASKKKAEERLAQVEMFKHMKAGLELARSECYCESCGRYFFSKGNKRCDESICPFCGEQDDIVEVTGVID